MSIAFKNWVMEEQEKDEEKMLIDEDNISTYKDIELIARSLKTSEKLEPYVQNRLDTIIKKCNERINSFEAKDRDRELASRN
jgi:geranylgeranyl pyrophosphate synthase